MECNHDGQKFLTTGQIEMCVACDESLDSLLAEELRQRIAELKGVLFDVMSELVPDLAYTGKKNEIYMRAVDLLEDERDE